MAYDMQMYTFYSASDTNSILFGASPAILVWFVRCHMIESHAVNLIGASKTRTVVSASPK